MEFPKRTKVYSATLVFENFDDLDSEQIEEMFPDSALAHIHSIWFEEETNLVKLKVWMWSVFVTVLDAPDFINQGLKQASEGFQSLAESLDCQKLGLKYVDGVEEEPSMKDAAAFDQYDMAFIEKHPKVVQTITAFAQKYPLPPSRGCGRITFYDPEEGCVYKIPLRIRGIKDNRNEADFCKDPESHLAPCSIINPGEVLPILKMEMLNTNVPTHLLPDWALDIEHHQVGFDTLGNIKAFDLY